MKKLLLLSVALILSVLVGLLGTYVVLSISNLYSLSFLADLGFIKLYGLLSIIMLLNYKPKLDDLDDNSVDTLLKDVFNKVYNKTMIYLVFWGFAYLMYYILNY